MASPPATAGTGHGERRPEPASATATAGPTLHQAIQAAKEGLSKAWHRWELHPDSDYATMARIAVEAAWPLLTQPLADLQRELDHAYTNEPPAWGHEAAAELDRLAAFEVAIRNALKPWTWNGIDADGKSHKDVIDEVAAAVAALDRAAEGGGQP